jgi:hypothetical protein
MQNKLYLKDFKQGYNKSKYLLVIKDKYSGKLFRFILINKDGAIILRTIKGFKR